MITFEILSVIFELGNSCEFSFDFCVKNGAILTFALRIGTRYYKTMLFNLCIKVSKSISRVLYPTIIYLGTLSPVHSCDLPTGQRRAVAFYALFGLAPGGVYMARLLPACR